MPIKIQAQAQVTTCHFKAFDMASTTKLQYVTKVNQEGRFALPDRFYTEVGGALRGKEIVIEVSRKKKRSTWEQHKYYRGCVLIHITAAINEQQGEAFTAEEIHGYMAHRFLKVQKVNEEGEAIMERVRSSAELSRYEYCVFVDQCIQFANEFLRIEIPAPHTVKDEFETLEYQQPPETRAQYLARIAEYLQDIFDETGLQFYFRQNPDWKQDAEVRTLFNERFLQVKK